MWPTRLVLAALSMSLALVPHVQAVEPSTVEMWECPSPDGTMLYTNKERPGCQPKALSPLSISPSLPDILSPPTTTADSTYRPNSGPKDFLYDTPIGALRNSTQIPDWGRNWYAGISAGGSVQADICGMYMEWIQLTQKSRGGIFFGTDPSYGGDPTARNWYGPSYSYYDNARYMTLSRIFGAGFIPIGCH
jgi:hypothetical protein